MGKVVIGITVTVVAGLILGLTTWNFAATQGAVNKTEHKEVHDKLEKKIDKMYDLVLKIYERGD